MYEDKNKINHDYELGKIHGEPKGFCIGFFIGIIFSICIYILLTIN